MRIPVSAVHEQYRIWRAGCARPADLRGRLVDDSRRVDEDLERLPRRPLGGEHPVLRRLLEQLFELVLEALVLSTQLVSIIAEHHILTSQSLDLWGQVRGLAHWS